MALVPTRGQTNAVEEISSSFTDILENKESKVRHIFADYGKLGVIDVDSTKFLAFLDSTVRQLVEEHKDCKTRQQRLGLLLAVERLLPLIYKHGRNLQDLEKAAFMKNIVRFLSLYIDMILISYANEKNSRLLCIPRERGKDLCNRLYTYLDDEPDYVADALLGSECIVIVKYEWKDILVPIYSKVCVDLKMKLGERERIKEDMKIKDGVCFARLTLILHMFFAYETDAQKKLDIRDFALELQSHREEMAHFYMMPHLGNDQFILEMEAQRIMAVRAIVKCDKTSFKRIRTNFLNYYSSVACHERPRLERRLRRKYRPTPPALQGPAEVITLDDSDDEDVPVVLPPPANLAASSSSVPTPNNPPTTSNLQSPHVASRATQQSGPTDPSPTTSSCPLMTATNTTTGYQTMAPRGTLMSIYDQRCSAYFESNPMSVFQYAAPITPLHSVYQNADPRVPPTSDFHQVAATNAPSFLSSGTGQNSIPTAPYVPPVPSVYQMMDPRLQVDQSSPALNPAPRFGPDGRLQSRTPAPTSHSSPLAPSGPSTGELCSPMPSVPSSREDPEEMLNAARVESVARSQMQQPAANDGSWGRYVQPPQLCVSQSTPHVAQSADPHRPWEQPAFRRPPYSQPTPTGNAPSPPGYEPDSTTLSYQPISSPSSVSTINEDDRVSRQIPLHIAQFGVQDVALRSDNLDEEMALPSDRPKNTGRRSRDYSTSDDDDGSSDEREVPYETSSLSLYDELELLCESQPDFLGIPSSPPPSTTPPPPILQPEYSFHAVKKGRGRPRKHPIHPPCLMEISQRPPKTILQEDATSSTSRSNRGRKKKKHK